MSERMIVAELGWCLAKITVTDGRCEKIVIVSPSQTVDDHYAPCESVCVYGRKNLVKLRDLLAKALKADRVHP